MVLIFKHSLPLRSQRQKQLPPFSSPSLLPSFPFFKSLMSPASQPPLGEVVFECRISKGCHSWRDIQSFSSQSIVYKYIDIYIYRFHYPLQGCQRIYSFNMYNIFELLHDSQRGKRGGGPTIDISEAFPGTEKQLTLGKGKPLFS